MTKNRITNKVSATFDKQGDFLVKIITAEWLFDGEKFLKNKAVLFEEKILAVDTPDTLKKRYSNAEFIDMGQNSTIMPGFINPHVHLEFGANKTHLSYGNFMTWLNSVIQKRDELIESCKAGCYKREIDEMLASGITTFGAVSSYGKELRACLAAPQRVIFFNEAIGSQPAAVDALYADFLQRLNQSREAANDKFIPAIAIHSPYSVHPILIKKILQNIENEPLSAHFMESPVEKEWLEKADGPFKEFFENFLNQTKPLTTAKEFLKHLDGYKALLTHAVWADKDELNLIADAGHTIIHCPRSNRLLGCGRLRLEKLNSTKISWLLGTDGLSSNTSLNLWDEMRSALMMHYEMDLESLALDLLKVVTSKAANALNLPIGEIKEGNWADIIIVTLPDIPESSEQLPLQLILHTTNVKQLYISGEKYA